MRLHRRTSVRDFRYVAIVRQNKIHRERLAFMPSWEAAEVLTG